METMIRLGAAFGIFLLMIIWEYCYPRRSLNVGRMQRWPINLSLAMLNMVIMKLSIGALAYVAAIEAASNDWGLLNQLDEPGWLSFIITLLALDFAIYYQHKLMHRWPILWRLHQVHHTDLDFDASTAVRFHPLEIVLSMLYKVACVYLLGAEPYAVIAFEVILNAAATFNHSNVNISPKIDRVLRLLIITPDMHRIHHSTIRKEMDSNYGFSISCWDRWFGSYTAHPEQPQTTMPIGLPEYRQQEQLGFWQLIRLPLRAMPKR